MDRLTEGGRGKAKERKTKPRQITENKYKRRIGNATYKQ